MPISSKWRQPICSILTVQNHPFVDGNKRVGVMAAFTFLKLNGVTLAAPDTDFEKVVLGVAQGKLGKSAIAEFLRKHSRR